MTKCRLKLEGICKTCDECPHTTPDRIPICYIKPKVRRRKGDKKRAKNKHE